MAYRVLDKVVLEGINNTRGLGAVDANAACGGEHRMIKKSSTGESVCVICVRYVCDLCVTCVLMEKEPCVHSIVDVTQDKCIFIKRGLRCVLACLPQMRGCTLMSKRGVTAGHRACPTTTL